MPWGLIIKAAVAAAILLSVYLAYQWFVGVLQENKELTAMNLQLETKIGEERVAHQETKEDYANWRTEVTFQMEAEQLSREELQTRYEAARKESDELSKKLGRHDLEQLASRKAGLIEPRVNRATDRVFRDIEKLTADFAGRGAEAPATP